MNIAIIGAGATGLAAANLLSKKGHHVTIFEAQSHPGGLAAGFKQKNWDWSLEHYYHHWFASDHHLLNLVKELGLDQKVLFQKPKTAVYFQDKFYPFDSIKSVFSFPGLSFLQTLRFGLVTLYLKHFANWKSLESHTAHEWLNSKYGKSIYQTTWLPMIQGKFGPYYQQANMAWMWARIKARTPSLGTYQGGFQQFFHDFSNILRDQGVDINFNSPVKKISLVKKQISIKTESSSQVFDKCLVTTSPELFNSLVSTELKSYKNKLKKLNSLGALVLILSLDKPLSQDDYYWYNLPKSKGFPFLALVEHTNFVSSKHFDGQSIIYCGDYLESNHEYFKYSKKELITKFTPTLKKINSNFSPDWIKESWIFKSDYAQPIPPINHSKNIPPISTPISNLFYAGMSQVYPWDRGTNFAVKLGIDAAQEILDN